MNEIDMIKKLDRSAASGDVAKPVDVAGSVLATIARGEVQSDERRVWQFAAAAAGIAAIISIYAASEFQRETDSLADLGVHAMAAVESPLAGSTLQLD